MSHIVIEYINQHQGEFWIAVGFAILILEVILLGLATGVLLFVGLGALATGLMMLMGILPETWLAGFASFGISSAVVTALLWRPLKHLQGARTPSEDRSSDLIGLEFVLAQNINKSTPGKTRYSGVDWRVEVAAEAGVESVATGQRVTVVSVDVGVFHVKPISHQRNQSN